MSDPRYPEGCTTAEHDEVWGTTDEKPFAYCTQCESPITFEQADGNTVVEVGKDTFCNNACRAKAIYGASERYGKIELKKLVAALYLLSGISELRMPKLKEYEADECIHKPDAHATFHVIELDDFQKDARALLAQIGNFGDETPVWAQEAMDTAEDFAAIIGEQVTA